MSFQSGVSRLVGSGHVRCSEEGSRMRLRMRDRAWRRAWRVSLAILIGVLAAAAPAHANAGKVLVFTGTAGTPNASSADVAAAITALGTANDFTVDTTSAVSDINATKLAGYRSVVFVNSSGDVLDVP